uniref:BAG cochaperone 3 n=1 Tax=Leptobrachium leishanense TaxID=445787 RepID=A0A8C5QI89_9ANUR
MQRVKHEPISSPKRSQSPLRSYNRPQSPAWTSVDSPLSDRQGGQPSGSPTSSGSPQGPSPPPSVADSQNSLSQSPGKQSVLSQSPGRQSTGGHQLPRGYISIPVFHESNVPRQPAHSYQYVPKAQHHQPSGEFQPHQPVFGKVQDEQDSRSVTVQPPCNANSSRESSPVRVVTQSPTPIKLKTVVDKPQVQQIHIQRESPTRYPPENKPSSPVPTELPIYTPVQVTFKDSDLKSPPQQATAEKVELEVASPVPVVPEEEIPVSKEQVSQKETEAQQKHVGLIQVERILQRVEGLEKDVLDFQGRRSKKQYLVLEEDLTKLLLALDSVDPEGRDDVRQARRDGVRKVQNILEALEEKACGEVACSQVVDSVGGPHNSMEVDNVLDRSQTAGSPGVSYQPISGSHQEVATDPSSIPERH